MTIEIAPSARSRPTRLFRQTRHRIHTYLLRGERRASIYERLRPRMGGRLPDFSTELVIEGPPRCGNTWSVAVFDAASNGSLAIASHLHSMTSVERAVRRGIPAIVLIRDPVASVGSHLVRDVELSAAHELTEYIRFTTRALLLTDHVLVVDFSLATTEPARMVAAFDDRFGTSLLGEGLDDAAVDRALERIDIKSEDNFSSARPHRERQAALAAARAIVETHTALVLEARSLYRQLLVHAVTTDGS